MELTIEEAATRSGKTVRQIRYMIQQGTITARKRAGRWYIDMAQLPSSEKQKADAARKQERLRAIVDDTLALEPKAPRYSLRDLKAVQIAVPLYQQLSGSLGDAHPAAQALRRSLDWLARGCHRFDLPAKVLAYQQARDEVSLAVCALLLEPPKAQAALPVLEGELLPAVAGLLRRLDRRRPRPS